jgi:hypothetical protein
MYFLGGEQGPIKIGWTKGDPETRLRALQTGNPTLLSILGTIECSQQVETLTHVRLNHCRLRGEWFDRQAALDEFAALKKLEQARRKRGRYRIQRPPRRKPVPDPPEREKCLSEIDLAFADYEAEHGPISALVTQRGGRA